MKKITLFIASLFFVSFAHAQSDDEVEFVEIQAAYNACITFRDAAITGDTALIRPAAEGLRGAQTCDFASLRCSAGSEESLNGHLVFNVAFADSLADGRDAYGKADDLNRTSTTRGQYDDGKVHSKTCFVRAGKSTKYTFPSRGHQELAVVAESGGLVTVKIHVTNRAGLNVRYDDTKDVHQGRPQRKAVFELPTDRTNTVELEIVNCGKKDCSFVVISN